MNLKKKLYVYYLELHLSINLENWKNFLNWMSFLNKNYLRTLFENLTQNYLAMETSLYYQKRIRFAYS
jgi:hypothetical protein